MIKFVRYNTIIAVALIGLFSITYIGLIKLTLIELLLVSKKSRDIGNVLISQ